MTAGAVVEVLDQCRERGIRLTPVAPDRLRVEAPAGTLTDDLRALLAVNKVALLGVLICNPEGNSERAAIAAQAEARGYTLTDLETIAAPEDWPELERDPRLVEELLDALDRLAGKVPPSYTATVECAHCGPVWLRPGWPPGTRLASCVWCLSRVAGLLPAVTSVQLGFGGAEWRTNMGDTHRLAR